MRQLLSLSFTLLLGITLATACGGGGGDGTTDGGTPGGGTPGGGTPSGNDDTSSFSTGVPASTMASELTSEQAYAVCMAAADLMMEVEELGKGLDPCVAMGLTDKFQGGDTASCEAAVAECQAMAEPAEEEPGENEGQSLHDDCDPNVDTSKLADCDTTVGEMETCFDAMQAQMQAAVGIVNCDMTMEQAESMDSEQPQNRPSECDWMDQEACNISGDDEHGEDF